MQRDLAGVRVALLAADGYEQVELVLPRKRLEHHGAEVEVISLRPGRIRGVNFIYRGGKTRVDRTVFHADPAWYGALFLPGGFANPDLLRQSREALAFVRAFDQAGKPIASLCHGPWVLASAGLVRGRALTSWPGIADDMHNAGGRWRSEPVVRDGNWVTSRGPQDLPAFEKAMVELFAAEAPRLQVAPARSRWGDLAATLRTLPGTFRRLTSS